MTRKRTEEGMAVVVAIALIALLGVVAVLASGVVGLVAAHRRVAAAADLAALAGADALQRGGNPCVSAAAIAKANGATVISCSTQDASVEVVARVQPAGFLAGADLTARSRAGPS